MGSEKFQPPENTPRKPVVREFVTRDQRRSIFEMACVHFRSIRSIAKFHGLSDMEVQNIVFEQMTKRQDAALRRAYAAGRLSMLPPPVARKMAA